MTLHFAPQAEADFAAVVGYVAERNPVAAADFADRIFAIIDRLAASELEGAEQPFNAGEVVRSSAIRPVRVYYQRHADAFWVLRNLRIGVVNARAARVPPTARASASRPTCEESLPVYRPEWTVVFVIERHRPFH